MRKIPLRNRSKEVVAHALVDDEDYDRIVEEGSWNLDDKGYVQHRRKTTQIRLHRFVMGMEPGDPEIDHVDRNKLNNQKYNLRKATHAQNLQNQDEAGNSNNKSGHRGVFWNTQKNKWQAVVKLNGKQHHIGYFHDVDEAGQAARIRRAELMDYAPESHDL